jgi:hypothetical protein
MALSQRNPLAPGFDKRAARVQYENPRPPLTARDMGMTIPQHVSGYVQEPYGPNPTAASRPHIPGMVTGMATLGHPIVFDPPKKEKPQNRITTRATGTTGTNNPYSDVKPVSPSAQTPAQILAQLQQLQKAMGASGIHVPGALSLAHIASLVNNLPTGPHMPGALSLGNIQKSLTPGRRTPGYIDPQAAATAAAQQLYGGAVTSDQRALDQQGAQNKQNLSDIQNWYNTLVSQAKSGAASDVAGYDAAINSTGTLGGSVSGALGFDADSAGANTIGQTGSILNAAARMAAASGRQFDQNMITSSALAGVQDYQNQERQGNSILADLRGTLNTDTKNKGAAYQTALDAARQGNTQNAQSQASNLLGLNQAYQSNYQNTLKGKEDRISTLAGLNNQYSTQGLNALKVKMAGLTAAAGIAAIPGQTAVTAAKANQYNANAYKTWANSQAAVIKAHTDQIVAKAKAQGTSAKTALTNSQALFGLGGQIVKVASADPKAFNHDPLTGSVTIKNRKQAKTDIAAMILQAGYDPTKGIGKLMADTSMAMVLGVK